MSTNPNPNPADSAVLLGTIFRSLGFTRPSRARRLRVWLADALGIVVSVTFAACLCAAAIIGVIALAGAVI